MRKALDGGVVRDVMIAVFIGAAGAVGLIAAIYVMNQG
jgi:hypothetical protein